VEFAELFREGVYVVGEVIAVTEYQSQEDKARNRPGAGGCADARSATA
jgi:hypothetical protein